MNTPPKTPTCGQLVFNPEKVITALRQDAHFGSLVSYLRYNWEHIPIDQQWRYRLLCQLLLKQGKVSVQSQKNALQIIGTTRNLRIYFLKYGMIEELADLYLTEDRPADCFGLLLENGLLDRALEVFLNHTLWMNVPEKTVLKILDYVWAGHYFVQSTTQVEKASPNILATWKSDAVKSRNSQWKMLSCINSHPSECRRHEPLLADIEDPTIRNFGGLLEILNVHNMTSLTHFDEIPLKTLGESFIILLKCLWKDSVQGLRAMLLLAGVWQRAGATSQYSILAWSALHERATNSKRINYDAVVKAWIRSKTATALLTLHTVAKGLWKTKWPKHCLTHLSQGSCPQIGSDQSCTSHHGHQTINRIGCRLFIKDLLHLNQIFCNLAPLFCTQAMPKHFQQQYLGMRRYWLERLLRVLTYISSINQDASIILHFQTRLFREKRSLVTSGVEELLYFRLRQGWTDQVNLSWLLEQLQFAQINTCSFQVQYSRAILSQLAPSGHEGSLKNIISRFFLLQEDAGSLRHRDFQINLRAFLLGFDRFPIVEYSNMHAVTAVLESLAVYLILMTCPMAYVVPRSWLSLYMPSLIGHVERAELINSSNMEILRECLIDLVNGFIRLLWRVDQGFQDGTFTFSYGGKAYPKAILQQRNIELLSIALINAAEYQPQPPELLQTWRSFQKVLTYPSINLKKLEHGTISELGRKITLSLVKYGDKNKIQLVTNDSSQEHHFVYLHSEPGVEHRSMSDIELRLPRRDSIHLSPTKPSFDPPNQEHVSSSGEDSYTTIGNKAMCYTKSETKAVIKIQQWWKRCMPKLSQRRRFISSPEGQAYKSYAKLCAKHTTELEICKYLLSKGYVVYSKVITLQLSQSDELERILRLIENANLTDDSSYEKMDELLGEARWLETILENEAEKMSTKNLSKLVERGDLVGLRRVIEASEITLKDVEKDLGWLTIGVSKLAVDRRRSWPGT